MENEIYKIGKTYDVKCVQIREFAYGLDGGVANRAYFDDKLWVPVIGDMHTDVDIINFKHPHYHVDWRFVDAKSYRAAIKVRNVKEFIFSIVIVDVNIRETQVMPRRMIRQFFNYPSPIRFTEELEEHYKNARLKNHRCPHQGADLRSVAPNADGHLVCPLHGLRF